MSCARFDRWDNRASSSSTRCAWAPHSKGDDLRDDAEMASIRARDPLARLGVSLAPAVREGIEAWYAAGVNTLIVVPSSARGNQMVALQELIDLYR